MTLELYEHLTSLNIQGNMKLISLFERKKKCTLCFFLYKKQNYQDIRRVFKRVKCYYILKIILIVIITCIHFYGECESIVK